MQFLTMRELSKTPKTALSRLAQDGKAVLTNNGKPTALMLNISDGSFEQVFGLVQEVERLLAAADDKGRSEASERPAGFQRKRLSTKWRERNKVLTKEEIREKVAPLAEKYGVVRVEIFGSYANGSATPESDIDLLAEFSPSVPSIFKVAGFQEELRRSLGIDVDVMTLPLAKPKRISIDKTERII